MTYNVYSVRDAKTSFGNPFVDTSDASAERGFYYAFANNPGLISFSPSDFSLYCIGMFDTDSGHLTEALPRFICDATKFIKNGVDADEK